MFILNILIIIAIFGIILTRKYIYELALFFSLIIFCYSIILLLHLSPNISNLSVNLQGISNLIAGGFNYTIALDGISTLFIFLSTLLIPICILSGISIKYRKRLFFILLFLTELALINVFAVTELFYFYVFFEAVLIPMFLIIGIYGSRIEKISAAYHFFLYTLLGSLFFLLSIIFIHYIVGTSNFQIIKSYNFSLGTELLCWLAFFTSFAAKIPLFPVHLWLPKAHVEAPTAGSVLLAGILLKLGSYGFLRYSIFLLPNATEFFRPAITVLAVIGILYSSFTILRQVDLKRIVAYSSISHMSFVILGSFAGSLISLHGAFLLMIAHGLVSGGLFLSVGYLYDRYKSRNILYFRGLTDIMPLFAFSFFLLILANLGFPPTLNFISELLILSGVMELSPVSAFLSGVGIIFAGISGFWIFTRIFFGNFAITNGFFYVNYYYDLTRREFLSLFPLILLTVLLGFHPNFLLNFVYFEISSWGL